VEASNSCVKTLIFGSFYCLIVSFFYSPFLLFFFCLVFYCSSPFFCLVFYRLPFPPFFFTFVLSLFFGSCGFHLSLPQLCLGLKGLVVVVGGGGGV
jgi:hypothetical protein